MLPGKILGIYGLDGETGGVWGRRVGSDGYYGY